MNLRRVLRWLSARAAALAVSLGCAGAATAADVPAAPAPAYEAPCPTCGAAAAPGCTTGGCATCAGRARLNPFHKPCKPYVTQLCPGACFGYFQTQWHQWENVCPIPYQGAGISDAPRLPTPPVAQPQPLPPARAVPEPGKGSDAPPPKTTPMPMPMGTSPLPMPTPMPNPGGVPSIPTPDKFQQ